MSLLVASSSSPSSRRDGAPSLAASRAAGPVPPLEELLLEELLLEELPLNELEEPPLAELLPAEPLLDELLLEELLLADWTTAEPPPDELVADATPPDELLPDDELLALEAAPIPRLDAATMECDVVPHGSVPVKVWYGTTAIGHTITPMAGVMLLASR